MSESNDPIQEGVLIERGLYEQVVEGLQLIARHRHDGPDLDHPLYDEWVHDDIYGFDQFSQWLAQRLLTQLTEKQP